MKLVHCDERERLLAEYGDATFTVARLQRDAEDPSALAAARKEAENLYGKICAHIEYHGCLGKR